MAGAYTGFALTLKRGPGEQYLGQARVVLPEGLVGAIPSVTTCTEAQAQAASCPASSEIGAASAEAGAGTEPYDFTGGAVYLTGPYNGAPYGLLVEVPALVGPFNLGLVPVRAALNIDPNSARVIISSSLPTVFKGISLRLRSVSVDVTRPDFLFNPTACGSLAVESTLTGFVPGSAEAATTTVSSPFQVSSCSALAFRPKFVAASSSKTSKADGASVQTTIAQPAHEANIREVSATLPGELVTRLATLQKACSEATFAHDPLDCPVDSKVGGVRVHTPVLAGTLAGPAYLVSHGGAAFPDLDLILEGDGVRVILTGHTQIKGGITTTTFASLPDVPISSVAVNLPVGPHSALASNGNLCTSPLVMPTTLLAQDGAKLSQRTRLAVAGCGVRVLRHSVRGDRLLIAVATTAPGRVSVSGPGLQSVYRHLAAADRDVVLSVALSSTRSDRRRPVRVRVRVGFLPRDRGLPTSVAYASATFR